MADRRGWAEDSIYWSTGRQRWVDVISAGFGPDGKRQRRQVSGRAKRDVQDKLKNLHEELDAGIRSRAGYFAGTPESAGTGRLASCEPRS